MTEPKHTILLAGATGYIGGLLLPRLREREERLRCLARSPEKLQHLFGTDVDVVQANVLKPETLPAAMEDVDVAYYLIHSMGTGGDFHERDVTGARNFAEAAEEAGVQRIIYLGGLARGEPSELSDHLKSRMEVGNILDSTSVPVTELRASIIIGAGSASFEIIRDLVDKLPLMITPKWVNSRCEPIAVRDVISYLVGCLDNGETAGMTLEIGGGEVFTYAEMMKIVAEVMNRAVYMITVPVLTPRLSAYWLNLITSVPMEIAYPLVDGLRNDSYCTDHRIQELIPFERLSFREALRRSFEQESNETISSRWTTASHRSTPTVEAGPDRATDPLRDRQIINTTASPADLFHVISRIGGKSGYYFGNFLWKLRGFVDRLLGGPGCRRGRRHPSELKPGDTIDFWRVEVVRKNRYLRLRAEMKLPGTAWLEFQITPEQEGSTTFRQEATFAVHNLPGYLYWFVLLPIHLVLFRNLAKQIVARAEGNA